MVKTSVVACPLHHLLQDGAIADLRVAVQRTHEAAAVGSALINAYLRDRLSAFQSGDIDRRTVLADIDVVMQQGGVQNAFVLASGGNCRKAPPHLARVWKEMSELEFSPPPMSGSKTNYMRAYEARSMVATAKTALAMHFYNRVKAHVSRFHKVDRDEWLALPPEERKRRKLESARISKDILRKAGDAMVSNPSHHEWVDSTRTSLGLDVLLVDKPLAYHVKTSSSAILLATWQLSCWSFNAIGKAYSIYPLRTTMTPRFCHVDIEVLCQSTAAIRAQRSGRVKRAAPGSDAAAANKASLFLEKKETFSQVLRPGWEKRISHSDRFAFSFDTDGVSARLLFEKKVSPPPSNGRRLPSRGTHSIDDLKGVFVGDDVHVIGVDPGKVELMVASNDRARGPADPRPLYPSVRYTNAQRRFDMKTVVAQKKLQVLRNEHSIADLESDLARHNKRVPTLEAFNEYLREHFRTLRKRLDFYSSLSLRRRRWRS